MSNTRNMPEPWRPPISILVTSARCACTLALYYPLFQATQLWEKLRGICEKKIGPESDQEKRRQECQNLLLLYRAQEKILDDQEEALVTEEVGNRAGIEELYSASRKFSLKCKVCFIISKT